MVLAVAVNRCCIASPERNARLLKAPNLKEGSVEDKVIIAAIPVYHFRWGRDATWDGMRGSPSSLNRQRTVQSGGVIQYISARTMCEDRIFIELWSEAANGSRL